MVKAAGLHDGFTARGSEAVASRAEMTDSFPRVLALTAVLTAVFVASVFVEGGLTRVLILIAVVAGGLAIRRFTRTA